MPLEFLESLRELLDDEYDRVLEIIRELARQEAELLAREAIEKDRKLMMVKNAELMLLLNPVKEFMRLVDLGPFEEIVSVAIKGADGNVRIVGGK